LAHRQVILPRVFCSFPKSLVVKAGPVLLIRPGTFPSTFFKIHYDTMSYIQHQYTNYKKKIVANTDLTALGVQREREREKSILLNDMSINTII
jgi:hypothetical protein